MTPTESPTAEALKLARDALAALEAMAERYRPPGYPMPDAQKQARAALAAIDALPASVPSAPADSKCPECGNQTTTRNDRTENCTRCAWWAPVEDATAQAAPAPAEPADLLGEAAHAITALLSLIRRNAPELSGKTLGYAEAVAKRIDAAQAAPAPAPTWQSEPGNLPPLPQPDLGMPWRVNAPDGSVHCSGYTADQMRAYAMAARAQAPAAPAVAAPEPLRWQPIETAPKDGTMFLCWVSAVRYGETDEGQQYQQDASQIDFCWWRPPFDGVPDSDYFDNASGQVGDSQAVTHWMPLPAAPAAQEPQHG